MLYYVLNTLYVFGIVQKLIGNEGPTIQVFELSVYKY